MHHWYLRFGFRKLSGLPATVHILPGNRSRGLVAISDALLSETSLANSAAKYWQLFPRRGCAAHPDAFDSMTCLLPLRNKRSPPTATEMFRIYRVKEGTVLAITASPIPTSRLKCCHFNSTPRTGTPHKPFQATSYSFLELILHGNITALKIHKQNGYSRRVKV